MNENHGSSETAWRFEEPPRLLGSGPMEPLRAAGNNSAPASTPASAPPKLRRPGYAALYDRGELIERRRLLERMLDRCELCPRRCKVNRRRGELGFCRTGAALKVAAVSVHPWEEPPISGVCGSGTVFFSGCTLHCTFCQNYPISQLGVGRELSAAELAAKMLRLQRDGAHNLNLVTATHQLPGFLDALLCAIPLGLQLPIVYNSSGYERVEILKLLEGIVDIYLPDLKYADDKAGRFCSGVADYVPVNRAALKEMWRQVGPLTLDSRGLAEGGLLIRHLVLPGGLAGTREALAFLHRAFGPGVWVSLMHQYFPAHRAVQRPPLDRKVSAKEYQEALQALFEFGLDNGFVQDDCGASFG